MANSWAVGAASTLALFAWYAPPPTFSFPPAGPPNAGELLHWIVGFAALATWGYAIAVAAHGNKGALAALFVNALAALVAALAFFANVGIVAGLVVLAVVAAISMVAIASELRARRGTIQWGAAALYSAPTLALVVWQIARS